MQLVEKHLIKKSHKFYKQIDKLSFLSKNLYNCGVYLCHQSIFANQKRLTYYDIEKQLKKSGDYRSLPAKVSQQVLMQVERCFKSYEAALKSWKIDPSKFTGKPKIPKYKDKVQGRNSLTYTIQAISKTALNKGLIHLSKTIISIPCKKSDICQVRIIPLYFAYRIEIVYSVDNLQANLDQNLYAGLDLGLNNLATVISNVQGFKPILACGQAIKSCNQWYNKQKAYLQSLLSKNQYTSRKIEGLTLKRNNKVDFYLHTASAFIVRSLVNHKIGTLVIGKNDGWKQEINIGRRNNQNFTCIPHAKFVEQLQYKCELVGIKVVLTEESYTSKCSFLDLESIQKQTNYKGRRVKRGLFKSATGFTYNADCNGAGNILRNVVGNSLFNQQDSVVRCVVHPVRVKTYKLTYLDICLDN